jgi:hypothetical protein
MAVLGIGRLHVTRRESKRLEVCFGDFALASLELRPGMSAAMYHSHHADHRGKERCRRPRGESGRHDPPESGGDQRIGIRGLMDAPEASSMASRTRAATSRHCAVYQGVRVCS